MLVTTTQFLQIYKSHQDAIHVEIVLMFESKRFLISFTVAKHQR